MGEMRHENRTICTQDERNKVEGESLENLKGKPKHPLLATGCRPSSLAGVRVGHLGRRSQGRVGKPKGARAGALLRLPPQEEQAGSQPVAAAMVHPRGEKESLLKGAVEGTCLEQKLHRTIDPCLLRCKTTRAMHALSSRL